MAGAGKRPCAGLLHERENSMKTVTPDLIPAIDRYASEVLGIPTVELMRRAGDAVATAIAQRYAVGRVAILCGGGNNGGDGYAAALALAERGFSPLLVDVSGKGQRTEEGQYFAAACQKAFGDPLALEGLKDLPTPALVVDAVLGTGAQGSLTPPLIAAAAWMNNCPCPKVAIDVPLGVSAKDGSVLPEAVRADLTVVLSFMKIGLLSYPAREWTGQLLVDTLGLDQSAFLTAFPAIGECADDAFLAAHWPKRPDNSHKGSFGKALAIAGCQRYRGAALLVAEGAMRTGVGLLQLASEECVLSAAVIRTPETVCQSMPPSDDWQESDLAKLMQLTSCANAVLIGPGCGVSEGIKKLLCRSLSTPGAPLLIDADGLNCLAELGEEGLSCLRKAQRPVLLTPHPLEFSRLVGRPVSEVVAGRLAFAQAFAKEQGVYVLLKGAGTVIASPDGRTAINTSGSSALAKGGSGDVLSGMLLSLLAQGVSPFEALMLGAYLHGCAGEKLATQYSACGVLPSDLPRAAAMYLTELEA